jgi:Asp-tRNA(Asn)/Glu-tRNA(Gln) amidotransferase A subunit family amidase
VEVLDACLERLEALNPALNAVVTLDPRARDEARELERRMAAGEDVGPLAGLPVGIKDVTEVGGAAHHVRLAALFATTCPRRTRWWCAGCAAPAR